MTLAQVVRKRGFSALLLCFHSNASASGIGALSQDRISALDDKAFSAWLTSCSCLGTYDALFARTPSKHFVEHLRDGCIVSTQTMREVKLVCRSTLSPC